MTPPLARFQWLLPMMAACAISSTASAAERGVVVYEDGDCIVIETNLGFVLAEWYGGSAFEGQRVVGELNSYGIKELYAPNGNTLRVYIDDFWVDEDEAREWLAENNCS